MSRELVGITDLCLGWKNGIVKLKIKLHSRERTPAALKHFHLAIIPGIVACLCTQSI
jgi:hypothetical protein